ncbi:MAG: hypothetical protein KME28_20765 [Pelatocladus maniniholoensis HA4357-MV3]|uniref:Uncharacterized protein n=1 Tax=Pelatocladus maniniholoensis HA4357-MV3 TaxID=1117104 RepID=A0A9E3HC95_9NOST|nr:hypothetical protein [Pelatocladus maniniholoensis HA4357-MV3]
MLLGIELAIQHNFLYSKTTDFDPSEKLSYILAALKSKKCDRFSQMPAKDLYHDPKQEVIKQWIIPNYSGSHLNQIHLKK